MKTLIKAQRETVSQTGKDSVLLASGPSTVVNAVPEMLAIFAQLRVGDQFRVASQNTEPGSDIDGKVLTKRVQIDLGAQSITYTIVVG